MQEEAKKQEQDAERVLDENVEFYDPWQQSFSEDFKRRQQEFEF